jgi:hypothetical protein
MASRYHSITHGRKEEGKEEYQQLYNIKGLPLNFKQVFSNSTNAYRSGKNSRFLSPVNQISYFEQGNVFVIIKAHQKSLHSLRGKIIFLFESGYAKKCVEQFHSKMKLVGA